MKNGTPSKAITNLLNTENHDLKFILSKVKVLSEINASVLRYLEGPIASCSQVANLVGNKLTLIAANGSVATQIRFQTHDLIRKFKSDTDPRLQKIEEIQCKVSPIFAQSLTNPHLALKKNMSLLSLATAEIMQAMAMTIDDPKLKAVIERIASRVRK